jgi:hypothetical protein
MITKKQRLRLPCINCISFPVCNTIYCETQGYRWLSQEVRHSIFLSRMFERCSLLRYYLNGGDIGRITSRYINKVCRYYDKGMSKVDPKGVILNENKIQIP